MPDTKKNTHAIVYAENGYIMHGSVSFAFWNAHPASCNWNVHWRCTICDNERRLDAF